MNIISFHYKNAPIKIREQVAFSHADTEAIYSALKKIQIQCVILDTCNRTEIYYEGDENTEEITDLICKTKALDRAFIKKYAYRYAGDAAISHLIRVACGVDSMVLGEDEILRQLKQAYMLAMDEKLTSFELNTIFQMTLQAAKEIKTATGISTIPVSIGTLAANEVFGLNKPEKKVLVIGATGKIGSIVVKNLLSHGDVFVTGTYRHHGSSELNEPVISLPKKAGERFSVIEFSERYKAISDMDAVISATVSPHLTITGERLKKALPEISGEEKLFIDLAVPADIDDEIANINGVRLIGIDKFSELSKENNLKKREQADNVILSVNEWVDAIVTELNMHKIIELVPKLNKAVETDGMEKLIYSLRKYSDRETISGVSGWIKQYLAETNTDKE